MIVLFGSALGQAVGFVLLPVIARVYDADSIGRAASTLAFLATLSFLATLQYDQAVIVAKDEDLPYLLLLTVFVITGILGILALLMLVLRLVWAGSAELFQTLGVNGYLALLLLLYPWFLVLTNLRLRQNQLLQLGLGRLIYYGGGTVLQVVGGLLLEGNEATYLLAQALGGFLAVAYLAPWKSTLRWLTHHRLSLGDIGRNIRRVAVTYGDFPRYQVGAQVFNAFSNRVPILFLQAFFSSAWAGWYYMAFRLLAVPTALLSQAVGQILFRDSAERERQGLELSRQTEGAVAGLMRVSLLPAIALGITAPFLVKTLLGAGWDPVGPMLQILLLTFIVSFFTSPISTLLTVKGRQKQALYFNVLLFVCRAGSLLVAWFTKIEWTVIWGYSIASLVVLLPFFSYVMRSVDASIGLTLKRIRALWIDAFVVLVIAALLWVLVGLDNWVTVGAIIVLLGIAGLREIRRVFRRQEPIGGKVELTNV